ncbi:radical SAM/SPASM domain-containing protein [Marinilabilia salmonicolor]|uniref:radical SAM/SPASM domain-containing protein n=1 Tax=Marinilabilia salmonicolor TaxID=989 RepID=UPI0015E68751|nr:radical SAM/SPASM domain-containing protein [Marinilabilia salmonicolor]
MLYLKSLNIPRLLNLLKLVCGFILSRIVGKPLCIAHPFALSVEPSGHCQLKCPECPTGAAVLSRKKGNMNIDLFNKIINETEKYIIYLNLYFQGEPLLHPQIEEFIEKAKKNRIYTTISTNAQLLDQQMCRKLIASGLSRIVISLDGFSQGIYETYRRGGKVETVKNGIIMLIQARKESGTFFPIIVVQVLAFDHNKHEIPAIREWCKEVGVDKLEIKTAQMNEFGDGTVQPAREKSRYQNSPKKKYTVPGRPYNHCWRQWSSAVITWNGLMVPCCYDKNAEYILGNASSSTFSDNIKKPESYIFKQTILSNRKGIEMCRNCPEGRNWFWG